jgi:hypothetical protein
VIVTRSLLILVADGWAVPPAVGQATELSQHGCGAAACGVVPVAWDSPYPSDADPVKVTSYANVANDVGDPNVANPHDYTKRAHHVADRNAGRYVTGPAGH